MDTPQDKPTLPMFPDPEHATLELPAAKYHDPRKAAANDNLDPSAPPPAEPRDPATLPNNATARRETTPTALAWNDPQILTCAGRAPEPIIDLLAQMKQPIPTTTAVYQWVSRNTIPDAWRPRLVYALLKTHRIELAQLFRVVRD
jgi:hypothetical protein